MTAIGDSLLTWVPAGRGDSGSPVRALRVAFVRDEWIPPQRPLSEETTMKSLFGVGVSEGVFTKSSVAKLKLRGCKEHQQTYPSWQCRTLCRPASPFVPLQVLLKQSFSSTRIYTKSALYPRDTRYAHFCDFLDVPDRLEAEFKFAQSSHVANLCRCNGRIGLR